MSNLFFKGSRTEVTLPLKAECLSPTGGSTVVSFKGKFKVINTDEQKELRDAIQNKSMTGEDVIRRLLVGWADVQDQENQPIEFSEENLEAALLNPFYLDALGEGALVIVYGKKTMEEVRRKNSSRQGSTG